jgi:hypothetical protein
MRRLLMLPVGLALGWLAADGAAVSQPGIEVRAPQGGAPAGRPPGLPGSLEPAPAAPVALPFPVTADAGEWVICAAAYSGPDAPELARQVVLELRNKHRLPAYTFNHADQERQKYEEEYKRLKERYPGAPIKRRTVRVQEHCAVLIGGFKDMDAASAALKRVRALPLPDLKLGGGKTAFDTVLVAEPDPARKETAIKRTPVNPFSTALVVRNPTVPRQAPAKAEADRFLVELNADEEYNLLKCPKPWTLAVKEYTCSVIVPRETASSSFLKMLGFGRHKPGDVLGASAKQAHELARVLRDRNFGFTTYVLHTRTSSLVTVGAFDGPDDPALQRTQARVAAMRVSSPGVQGDPFGLLPNPVPVQVPRP